LKKNAGSGFWDDFNGSDEQDYMVHLQRIEDAARELGMQAAGDLDLVRKIAQGLVSSAHQTSSAALVGGIVKGTLTAPFVPPNPQGKVHEI
jgi:hypothetical protein